MVRQLSESERAFFPGCLRLLTPIALAGLGAIWMRRRAGLSLFSMGKLPTAVLVPEKVPATFPERVPATLNLVGLVSPEVVGRPVDAVLADSPARWLVTCDTHFNRAVTESQRFSTIFERRTTVRVSDGRALEVYERRGAPPCATP